MTTPPDESVRMVDAFEAGYQLGLRYRANHFRALALLFAVLSVAWLADTVALVLG